MNKNTQRVIKKHEYYHNKVELLEEERNKDRSWASKELISRYKKIKLKLKDAINVRNKYKRS